MVIEFIDEFGNATYREATPGEALQFKKALIQRCYRVPSVKKLLQKKNHATYHKSYEVGGSRSKPAQP